MNRTEEFNEKLTRVRGWLKKENADGVLLAHTAHVAWLSCGGSTYVNTAGERGVAMIYVDREAATLITNRIERARMLEEEFDGLDLRVSAIDWHADMEAHIRKNILNGATARTDLPYGDLPPAGSGFPKLMYTLTDPEIDRYRALGRDTGEALEATCRGLSRGLTENTVAARLAAACLDRGVHPTVLLIAADERIRRYRHPLPTANKLDRTVMVVVCGRRHGLVASATRMVSFGAPDPDLVRRHASVVRVDATLNGLSRPGRTAADIFRTAVAAYRHEGFDGEWNLHHQGGGAGYYGRYYFGSEHCEEPVGPRQAFAWNPSITGTKSEDTLLVLDSANEFLTATGAWPTLRAEAGGLVMDRPDILAL